MPSRNYARVSNGTYAVACFAEVFFIIGFNKIMMGFLKKQCFHKSI